MSTDSIKSEIRYLQHVWRSYGYRRIIQLCIERVQKLQQNIDAIRKHNQHTAKLSCDLMATLRLAEWSLADKDCTKNGSIILVGTEKLFNAATSFTMETAQIAALEKLGKNALRATAFQQFPFQYFSAYSFERLRFILNKVSTNNKLKEFILTSFGAQNSDELHSGLEEAWKRLVKTDTMNLVFLPKHGEHNVWNPQTSIYA